MLTISSLIQLVVSIITVLFYNQFFSYVVLTGFIAIMHAFKMFIRCLQYFDDVYLQEKKKNILHNSWAQELTGTGARRLSVSVVMDIS